MSWQEHALPAVLVGLGKHILPQMWETIQVPGIAQGVLTRKGKGRKRGCVHLQLMSGKEMEKYTHLLMAIVERQDSMHFYMENRVCKV